MESLYEGVWDPFFDASLIGQRYKLSSIRMSMRLAFCCVPVSLNLDVVGLEEQWKSVDTKLANRIEELYSRYQRRSLMEQDLIRMLRAGLKLICKRLKRRRASPLMLDILRGSRSEENSRHSVRFR